MELTVFLFHRYPDVDVPVGTVLRRQHPNQRQVLTYDINCQYKINFEKRVNEGRLMPISNLPKEVEMKIPVWHMGGHVPECQDDHHLRHTPLVGRSYGEGVETLWGRLNGYKYATREMGHGHRCESLTDGINDGNWTKVSAEGPS